MNWFLKWNYKIHSSPFLIHLFNNSITYHGTTSSHFIPTKILSKIKLPKLRLTKAHSNVWCNNKLVYAYKEALTIHWLQKDGLYNKNSSKYQAMIQQQHTIAHIDSVCSSKYQATPRQARRLRRSCQSPCNQSPRHRI